MVEYYFENVLCIFYHFSLKVNESTYSFKLLYGMHQCSTQSFLGIPIYISTVYLSGIERLLP